MKKMIALILCGALLLQVVSVSAYADNITENPTPEAVAVEDEDIPSEEEPEIIEPEEDSLPEEPREPKTTIEPKPETTVEPEPEATAEPEATVTPEPETTTEPEATATPEPAEPAPTPDPAFFEPEEEDANPAVSGLSGFFKAIIDTEAVEEVVERPQKGRTALLQDANELLLDLSNDTTLQYLFSEEIKFRDENGDILYKDTSIIPQTDEALAEMGYEYANGVNNYRIAFSADPLKGILISDFGNEIGIAPAVENALPKMTGIPKKIAGEFGEEDAFEYASVFGDSTVLRFTPQLNGCKKEIILAEYSGTNSFSFRLSTGNLNATVNEEGQIQVIDPETEAVVSTFAAPFAYDSSGGLVSEDPKHYRDDCSYELGEKTDGTYLLTITVPEEFLTGEETVYPVVIDPVSVTVSNSLDTTIHSGKSTMTSGSDDGMGFGKTSDFGSSRALVKFTIPTAIKSKATIVSAYYWARELTARTSTTYVSPYIVNASWDNNTSWSTRPGYDTASGMTRRNINSKSNDSPDNTYWYKFNIKPAVQKWVNGEKANNGLIFVSEEEGATTYNWRSFATKENTSSGLRPYVVIAYSNKPAAPSSVTVSPTAWTKGSIKVTHTTVTDTNGIAKYQYALGTSATAEPTSYADLPSPTALTHTLAAPTKGTRYVWVRAVNKDGAVGAGKCSTAPYKYDPDPPVAPASVTIAPTAWTNGDITVSHGAVTDASGIAKYQYATSASNTTAPTAFTDLPSPTAVSHVITGAPQGTFYVWVRAVDKAGNAAGPAKCSSAPFKRDTAKPKTPTSLKLVVDSAKPGNKKLVWQGASDALSGLSKLQYKLPGGSYATVSPVAANGEFSFACAEAVTDVSFKLIDAAGNYLEISTELKIDPPQKLAAKALFNGTTRLTWIGVDFSEVEYDVYRALTTGTAVPADADYKLLQAGVKDNYWLDYTVADSGTCNYKLKARVTLGGESTESGLSAAVSAPATGAAVLNTKIGQREYEQLVTAEIQGAQAAVHPISGNFLYQYEDVNTNSATDPIGFTRVYNSLSWYQSPLGKGWDHSLNIALLKSLDSSGKETAVLLKMGDGALYRFTKTASGYTRPAGFYADLSLGSDGLYMLKFYDKSSYYFNQSNQISKAVTPYGKETVFSYNENGNLLKVVNPVGDEVNIVYRKETGKTDLISSVTAGGVSYSYEYNTDDTLKRCFTVKEEAEISEAYTYASGLLQKITNANGDVYTLSYAADKKLNKLLDPENEAFTVSYSGGTVTAAFKGSTIVQNYSADMLLSSASLNGRTTSYTYDSDYNITKITEPDGKTTGSSYDARGNVLTSTDAAGNTTSYSYDTGKDVPKEISAPFNGSERIVTKNTYDAKDQLLTSYIVGTNKKTFNEYDANGNCVKTTTITGSGAEGLSVPATNGFFVEQSIYAYDIKNRVKTTTQVGGSYGNRVTETKYDEETNAIMQESSPTVDTAYTYDELGQVTETVMEDGQISDTNLTGYDNMGNVVEEVTAAGSATAEYDELGRIIRSIDENGVVEETRYGKNEDGGCFTIVTRKSGEIILSRNLSVSDRWGNCTLQGSCAVNGETGSLSYKEFSLVSFIQSQFDNASRVLSTQDSAGISVSFEYDAAGRTLKETISKDGNSQVKSYTYDQAGNKLTETAPDGTVTSYIYDKLGRTLSAHKSKGSNSLATDSVIYDTVENGLIKLSYTDALGRVSVKYMNPLGDIIKEIYGTKTTSYSYDSATGNLLKSTLSDTDFSGQSLSTSYEYSGSQQVKKSYSTDHTVSYTYDSSNGNVLSETVSKGGVSNVTGYEYDKTGANVVKLSRNGQNQNFRYLPDGTRESLTYGSGQKTSYNYDSEGKLKTVVLGAKPIRSYVYSQKGVLDFVQSYTAAGTAYVSQRNSYDWLGRLTKTENLSEAGDVKEVHELKYGTDNNITHEKSTEYYNGSKVVDRLYEYDWLKRLTKETVNGTVITYTYDNVGNRLTMTSGGETLSYSYNAADQLTQIKRGSQVVIKYTYDLAGNQITKTEGGKTTTYTYDQANQLEKVQSGANILGEYTYDASGQRLTKKVGSTTTKYYYDGISLLYSDENGTVSEVNILGNDGDMILGLRGAKEYRYMKDVRGSVTNILDSAGAVVLSYTYDAYGNTTASGQSFKNSFAYTGAIIDPETGLYYMNARYYDPATGRFVSQDSYRGDGEKFWHLYVYCDGNPVNRVDPSGAFSMMVFMSSTAFMVFATVSMVIVSAMAIAEFIRAWNKFCPSIGVQVGSWLGGAAGNETWVKTQPRDISYAIKNSFAKTSGRKKYKTNKEVHHIVAKKSRNAKKASQLMYKHFERGPNNPKNLISIKTGLHRRLHTNSYYNYVNSLIIKAEKMGRTNKQKTARMITVLNSLRTWLSRLSTLSPY